MQSGLRVEPETLTYGGEGVARAAHRRDAVLGYETVVLTQDARGETVSTVLTAGYKPAVERARQQAEFGAAARSATRTTGARRFAVTRPAQVQVQLVDVEPQRLQERDVVPA